MRAHLSTCFEKKVMQCFPTSKKRRISGSIVKMTKIAVYCTCRLSYCDDPDKSEKMICCDTCKQMVTHSLYFWRVKAESPAEKLVLWKVYKRHSGFEPLNLHIKLIKLIEFFYIYRWLHVCLCIYNTLSFFL